MFNAIFFAGFQNLKQNVCVCVCAGGEYMYDKNIFSQ